MIERTKKQTEDEITWRWVDSLKTLTEKIDEQDLGKWVARKLVLTDDISHNRDCIMNAIPQSNLIVDDAAEFRVAGESVKRIQHWSDWEIHEELLMRKKGQNLFEDACEHIMEIFNDSPNDF